MVRKASAIGGEVPTNGAHEAISLSVPYTATVQLTGTADLLFHRWNCEAVEAKAGAAKGSKTKKSDNLESYVSRDDEGHLCLPGEYVRQSIIHGAKYRQDPRSPRKSAMDLYKAGVVSLTTLGKLLVDKEGEFLPLESWQYEHKCRVTVQRAGITRTRPAVKAGWQVQIQLMVLLPEYVRPADLHDVLSNAGRLVGVGDFRPTYGRFRIDSFDLGME